MGPRCKRFPLSIFCTTVVPVLVLTAPLTGFAQRLLTSVTVGSDPVAVALNARTGKIYTANQLGNDVTVIDAGTYATTTVAAGNLPMAVAANPVTNKVYIANGNSNSVTVIDGPTNRTQTVAVGSYPKAVAVNTSTNRIYVANYNGNTVTEIDGATNTTTTIGVGSRPLGLAVNTSTNKIYVANYAGNTVTVIHGNTRTTTTIGVGARPRAIALNPYTNRIYVANFVGNTVSVIDGDTNSVTDVNVGSSPAALAVDPMHDRVYVANSGESTATVIHETTLATTTVNTALGPIAVQVDSMRNKAYFACPTSPGVVSVVSGVDFSSVDITVGQMPASLVLNPDSNRLYTANEADNSVSVVAAAQADPLQFTPITPCRVADTRWPTGTFGGPAIAGGTSRSFPVPQSNCGVPDTALAYALNVTVVPTRLLSYLTLWPAGQPQPSISTLNSLDGRVKANAAIVAAGGSGAVNVFATETTQVILDINGYFQLANGLTLQFYPLSPCRVVDTREQRGYLGAPYLTHGRERDFPVLESNCRIPGSAQAYSINFTVAPWQGKPLGYLSVWAAGGGQPLVSTLNNPTATVVANAAIVPAGVGGAIAVYPDQDTQLVADINGYFAAPGEGGLSLYVTPPCRELDTRSNGGAFTGRRSEPIGVANGHCGIPSEAQSYVFNATAVPTGPLGYLTLWPDGQSMPLASTLNALDAIITSNMAILPSSNGKIDAYASGTSQLILDISSYFAP